MEMHTLVDLVRSSASRFAGQTAITCDNNSITYRELDSISSNIAAHLISNGISRGEKVAILSENRIEWGIVFFGALKAGATAVCMDPFQTTEEIRHILGHSEASCIFASETFTKRLNEISHGLPSLSHWHSIETIAGLQPGNYEPPAIDENDEAILIYTSGTTGSQKGVVLTHKNVLSNVRAASVSVPLKPGTSILSLLPLSHMFGITVGLIGPLLNGGKIAYSTSLKGHEIINAMSVNKVNVMVVVPLMLRLFKNMIRGKAGQSNAHGNKLFDISLKISALCSRVRVPAGKILFRRIHRMFGGNLQYFLCGGAPLERETEDFFEMLGFPVLSGYGLTETSPIVSVCSLKKRKPGTVGKPLQNVDVGISAGGEILISGPGVMKGYYKDPGGTARVLSNNCFHTGDIGEIDRDGYLSIRGRKKNVIVTASGLKIFPEEIEELLAASPYIDEVCVLGKPTSRGERAYAVVVPSGKCLKDTPPAGVFDLIRREIEKCQEGISKQKQVAAFEVWETELPKTTTRKVKRPAVLKMLTAKSGQSTADSKMEILDAFGLKVRSLTAGIAHVPEAGVTLKSSLAGDLGIDSLTKVEVFDLLEREFDVSIPDEEACKVESFQELLTVARTFYENPAEIRDECRLSIGSDISGLLSENLFYRFTRLLSFITVKTAARIFLRLKVSGIEHVPVKGSFIVASNHHSLLDFPLIYASLPGCMVRKIVAPAARDFFFEKRLPGFFVRSTFNAFPLDRYGNFLEGLNVCARLLKSGRSIILFPEGTRSRGGELQPFKPGIGMLSLELNVPIVPAYIKGADRVLPKGKLVPRPRKVELMFGEPVPPQQYAAFRKSKRNQEIYKQMIDEIRKRIEALREVA